MIVKASLLFVFMVFSNELPTPNGQYCTQVKYSYQTVRVPETYSQEATSRGFMGRTKYSTTTNTRYVTKSRIVSRTVRVCCEGYEKMNDKCVPHCAFGCSNGFCSGPNTCTCYDGYEYLTQYKCKPKCDNCEHGICVSPGFCQCYYDFEKSANGTCVPICEHECVNGYCSAPDICSCNAGYYLKESPYSTSTTVAPTTEEEYATAKYQSRSGPIVCQPHCNESCINGYCSAPDECSCNAGYKNISSTQCIPICSTGCRNGLCIMPEQCLCYSGFELNPTTDECEPICTMGCTNGRCTSPEVCQCNEGFQVQPNSVSECEPKCDPNCESNEFCHAPNECRCAPGYKNDSIFGLCMPQCPDGCVNSNCSGPALCECWHGYQKDSILSNECKPICHDCDQNECIGPDMCMQAHTTQDWSTAASSFDNEIENLSSSIGYLSQPSTIMQEPTMKALADRHRNWNDHSCSSNCTDGICLDGVCHCENGYTGEEWWGSSASLVRCIFDCDDGFHFLSTGNCICAGNDIEKASNCDSFCDRNDPYFVCVLPRHCNCTDGYEKNALNMCVPACSDCTNQTCIAPDVCRCRHQNKLFNPLDPSACDYFAEGKNNVERISLANPLLSNYIFLVILIILIASAIVLITIFIYMKRKDYNVDKKEKVHGAYRYQKGSIYYDDRVN